MGGRGIYTTSGDASGSSLSRTHRVLQEGIPSLNCAPISPYLAPNRSAFCPIASATPTANGAPAGASTPERWNQHGALSEGAPLCCRRWPQCSFRCRLTAAVAPSRPPRQAAPGFGRSRSHGDRRSRPASAMPKTRGWANRAARAGAAGQQAGTPKA